jgi:hypothetical protein
MFETRKTILAYYPAEEKMSNIVFSIIGIRFLITILTSVPSRGRMKDVYNPLEDEYP